MDLSDNVPKLLIFALLKANESATLIYPWLFSVTIGDFVPLVLPKKIDFVINVKFSLIFVVPDCKWTLPSELITPSIKSLYPEKLRNDEEVLFA